MKANLELIKQKFEDIYKNNVRPNVENFYNETAKPVFRYLYNDKFMPKFNEVKENAKEFNENNVKPRLDEIREKAQTVYKDTVKPRVETLYENILKPTFNKIKSFIIGIKDQIEEKYQAYKGKKDLDGRESYFEDDVNNLELSRSEISCTSSEKADSKKNENTKS